MVHAAANLTPEQLSTKALAAAGQFRAIALWLNEPLIPQGIYAQVCQDKRPGCIRITVEFERTPNQKPLAQYICHLMWQLNSPLIEGIHLVARPVGARKPLWEQRIRVMTPALRERLNREQGHGSPAAAIPPAIAQRPKIPVPLDFDLHLFFSEQLKPLRAFMLTGSAVAAFVFGCMIEVVMSAKQEPALPFQTQTGRPEKVTSQMPALPPAERGKSPELPQFDSTSAQTVLVDRKRIVAPSATATAADPNDRADLPPQRDRPNVVNAALEPVGVMQHERLDQPQDSTVTLLFGGDVELDGLPYEKLAHDGQLLSGLPAYRQADIAMVNLQDPLATAATTLEEEFLERERPDAVNLLKEGGVDVVNLTGDEVLSFGEQGLSETLDNLDRSGIYRVGAGRSEREARRPEILDVKGQRIAYLSYDRDVTQAAYDTVGGVNAVAIQDIVKDIQAIRDEVDWLVVNYRWTEIPSDKPAESQTNLARLAIDQGADLVVGHHPTQLQGAEIYKGRPIAYSLGDFVFGPTRVAPAEPDTAIMQVSLREGQMKVDLIPVKVKDGQPQQANGADAQVVLSKIEKASQTFAQPLPASIVLDARSPLPTAAPTSEEDKSFTGDREPLTTPAFSEPAVPEATPDTPAPAETPSPDAVEAEPAEAWEVEDELLDIQIEDIPEELLENWGPKESPNTIYEPESALPLDLQLEPNAPAPSDSAFEDEAAPLPDGEAVPPPAPTHSPEPDVDEPLAAPVMASPEPARSEQPTKALESPPAPEARSESPADTEASADADPDAIAPYSEPLVGPMSSLFETAPPMKSSKAATLTKPGPQLGMPESRVFEPLNALEGGQQDVVTLEVQPDGAIASPTPDQ